MSNMDFHESEVQESDWQKNIDKYRVSAYKYYATSYQGKNITPLKSWYRHTWVFGLEYRDVLLITLKTNIPKNYPFKNYGNRTITS